MSRYFLEGMGSVLNLYSQREYILPSKIDRQEDLKNLAADMRAVGSDLNNAYIHLNKKLKNHGK